MEEVRFCAWCGKIVNLKFHYCPWCGKSLFKAQELDLNIDRVVNQLSQLHKNNNMASLEKMMNQLGELDEEISAILDNKVQHK
jgi:hypothetical protein